MPARILTDFLNLKPENRTQIAAWTKTFLDFDIHSHVACKPNTPAEALEWERQGKTPHNSQLDYVEGAFLGQFSGCVFVAARNAGKSYAAAIATILDCHFKPGIKVAVAAFQRNQSDYIYEYIVKFLNVFATKIGVKVAKIANITNDEITFINGSSVKFFSGGKSSAGIKGYHPNILICDEGDLFTADQFDGIANSLEAGGNFQRRFDVLSTNYTVHGDGVILRQIERYEQFNKTRNAALLPCKVFRICLLDILTKCDDRFSCDTCDLWKYCKGRAKDGSGFYKVESAMETMRDSSLPTFESQMLLLRPSSEFSYFTGFSNGSNVCDPDAPYDLSKLTLVNFDFGAGRCPHAALIVQKDPPTIDPKTNKATPGDPGTYWVIDEFLEDASLEKLTDRIKAKYPHILDADCFYDPKGNETPHIKNAKSYFSVLKEAGFFPRCRQLKRRPTFEQLNALISPASGAPRLKINARCKNLIAQIQAAEHKTLKGRIIEEPADIRPDDLLDCLRMAVGNTWGTYAKHNGAKRLLWFKI